MNRIIVRLRLRPYYLNHDYLTFLSFRLFLSRWSFDYEDFGRNEHEISQKKKKKKKKKKKNGRGTRSRGMNGRQTAICAVSIFSKIKFIAGSYHDHVDRVFGWFGRLVVVVIVYCHY